MSTFTRTREPDDDTLIKAATEALTRPDSYSTSDGRLFFSHGLTIGQHRDSDALDRSNYERISEDMRAEFPGDIDVQHFSHWAVGYGETLIVRVLRDPDDDITPENITAAFMVITAIANFLRCDYPVYDDAHYAELEWNQDHPSDHECYSDDEECPCAVRNHDHIGPDFLPEDADEDGEIHCCACGEYVTPGTRVGDGNTHGENDGSNPDQGQLFCGICGSPPHADDGPCLG